MEATSSAFTTTAASTPVVSSVHLTLPLTCQVCLGKVKDPVICANQHVFCSSCMSTWLQVSKSNMCPTCRVPVSEKQPFKRIIGSMEVSSTINDKSVREQMRRTRFEILFQEYEKEISSLEQQLEESKTENRHIKEINSDLKTRLDSAESQLTNFVKGRKQDSKNGDSQDLGTILKLSNRLQDMINFNSDLKEENSALKKQLQDVIRKNESLKEEMEKLSNANNYNMSPKKFSRYTVAALETKVDTYEREINRLKRALERSDEYIDDLKRQHQNPARNALRFEEMPSRMSERPLRNGWSEGAYESAFTAPNSSSQDIESPLISMQRRIDELATVALATSNSTYSKFSSSPAHAADMSLSGQLQMSYNVTSSENENETRIETPTARSIFEDPSKFPACAKLIELTKVRRDFGEQPPGEILPLDASGRLVDQMSNHSNSPKQHGEQDDSSFANAANSETTATQRNIETFQNYPSTSGISISEFSRTVSSPQSSYTTFAEVSCSKQGDNCDPCCATTASQTHSRDDEQFSKSPVRTSPSITSQSYPSSVVLTNENFAAKRIKIEEPE